MMIEGRLLLCLQMTSAEAHEAVRKAGLGEGMSERDAFAPVILVGKSDNFSKSLEGGRVCWGVAISR